MKRIFIAAVAVLQLSFQATANQETVRSLVHTLDYIARDYHHAVENGTIKEEDEYEEMIEFSDALTKQINELNLPSTDSTYSEIIEIKKLIAAKAESAEVATRANQLRQKLITQFQIKTSPTLYPDIERGKKIFIAECSKCHGPNGYGDGPEGKELKPSPRNFHDIEKMSALSPFAVFNTVRVGIEGTGMVANTKLTDKEVWDVAFYVLSLRYGNQSDEEVPEISLEEIAVSSDEMLLQKNWSQQQINALRNRLPDDAGNVFLNRTVQLLNAALAAYQNADYKEAERLSIAAYLEGVEPIEIHLKKVNEEVAEELEENVGAVRNLIKNNATSEEVENAIEKAIRTAKVASAALEKNKVSFGMAFSLTLVILLREGLEAFLVIMVLLAIMNKADLRERKKYIHLGWITAILLGIILWFLSGKAIQSGISNIELMEGAIALVAVVVMIYVGFWLHSKSKASEWKKYVETLVAKANGNGSVWGLAALAFFVSFREVFESLLFLSALQIQSKGTQTFALGSGVLAAFVIVLILAIVTLKFSAKLPLEKLFRVSAFTISILAFVLAGKGVHSFQEAGIVSVHEVAIPTIELLGIYATWESLFAQVLVLLAINTLKWINSKK